MIVQMKLLKLLIRMLPLVLLSLTSMLGHYSEMDSPGKRIRCLEDERKALLELKNELVDNYGRLSSWGDEKDQYECCEWRGVHCHNKTNHVTRSDLRNYPWGSNMYAPLEGTVSDSILELKHLAYLDLSSNNFSGTPIPRSIASLSSLCYLNLYGADFHGPIPHHLGNLYNLHYLDLGYGYDLHVESLSWVSNLHALEYLDLSYTNLSMATYWLQAVCNLTNLHALHLEDCSLQEIPSSLISSIDSSSALAVVGIPGNWDLTYPSSIISWLSNISSSLTFVNLDANNMSGPIPDVFEKMIALEHLSLADTGLVGGVPKYFGNMSRLKYLDLRFNDLNGELFDLAITNLSGPIEKTLQYLYLSQNSIRGLLPNLSRFSLLTELVLDDNQLYGSIQAGYLHLPYLLSLDLSSNRIAGPVPDLSSSSSLKVVYLHNNTFNGSTTKSIGGLHMLEVLWLGSNFLEGKITEAHMSNLSHLRDLDLSHNSLLTLKFQPHWIPPFQLEFMSLRLCNLGPYFPQWLKTQKRVEWIDISNAGISDIIPNWFGCIAPRVRYLNISNNQIHGAFPLFSFSHSPPQLESGPPPLRFYLSKNKMSSTITFLCHARDWALLDLSDNMFSGRIPNCFTQFESLVVLNLANNYLSGEIPGSIGALSLLRVLHLQNNSLSGVVPISMNNCTCLTMIDTGGNRLTGRISNWLGDSLSELVLLVLRSNNFYGSIPTSLCGLSYVQVFDLSSNKITGDIPGCVGNLTAMNKNDYDNNYLIDSSFLIRDQVIEMGTSDYAYFMWKGKEVKYVNHLGLVKLIDISNNNLEGEIPSGLTVLDGLVGLNLSGNHLTGYIPWNIGQLMSLNFLDLSRNHLQGGIPSSLSDLDSLGILNLSYNNLSGRIPRSNHALTFNEPAYIGNNDLCGQPLNKSCQGDHAPASQDPSVVGNPLDNQGQDDDDELISEGFYVAIVLGFVVGFWGIFGTILFNKALRFAFFDKLNSFGDFVYVRTELAKAHVLGH